MSEYAAAPGEERQAPARFFAEQLETGSGVSQTRMNWQGGERGAELPQLVERNSLSSFSGVAYWQRTRPHMVVVFIGTGEMLLGLWDDGVTPELSDAHWQLITVN